MTAALAAARVGRPAPDRRPCCGEPLSDDASYSCRVCGYEYRGPGADLPRGEDGESPTYTYCSCCGVEFGYQDTSPEAARSFRERWLANGAPWTNGAP